MKTTGVPNAGHFPNLPRVSDERALPCAGECGLVSQLAGREIERAASFTCSTCHERASKDVTFKARLYARLGRRL